MRLPGWLSGLALSGLLAGLIGVGTHFLRSAAAPPARSRPSSLLMIMPFRTAGADSSLQYLGEGMVDLLAARLNGAGGIRVVDPYAAVSAWKHRREDGAGLESEALAVARGEGADYAITAKILGGPGRLTIAASLLDVTDEGLVGAASVTGRAESLLVMVDQLAVELLSRQASTKDQRLFALRGEPLPAVRAYLDGMAAYRRGRYEAAVSSLNQALSIDSGFGLAAFGLMLAANVLPDPDGYDRGRRLSMASQQSLGAVDRLVLRAFAGADVSRTVYGYERLMRLDSAATLAPDRPDLWFLLGDNLYHFGAALDVDDRDIRARAAFEKALALDPEYEAPLEHLVDLAATAGDTRRLRPLAERYLVSHAASEHADYVRWRAAVAQEDETELRRLRARFDSMSAASLERIAGVAQIDGVAIGDAPRAVAALEKRAASLDQRRDYWTGILRLENFLARNLGHRREAERGVEALFREDPRVPPPAVAILNAMFMDGAPDRADSVARAHLDDLSAPHTVSVIPVGGRLLSPCLAALWTLPRHGQAAAERVVRQLEQAIRDTANAISETPGKVCLADLKADLALARGDRAAPRLLHEFDSTVTTVRASSAPFLKLVSLELGRLREVSGDVVGALRAVRRREYHWLPGGTMGLSTYLYREGQLAARVGDTAGAIRAYRHYLVLRSDPDPELVSQRDSARAALLRLTEHP